jgi:hypothetical protein
MDEQLIPRYTPLWRGEDECNKCDPIIIPVGADFIFALPYNEENPYALTIIIDNSFYQLELERIEWGDIVFSKVVWNNELLEARRGTTLDLIDVSNQCYEARLSQYVNRDYEDMGIIGNIAFPDKECTDYIKIDYELDCNQPIKYTYYLDGVLARQPLSLEDEVNAISPNGLSRRVFSRTQQTKELRVRPLTLATHELLEYILNLPSFDINGTTYTQAEGEVYTYVDAGTSGYYVGKVGLVSGGNVFRQCCDNILPSS